MSTMDWEELDRAAEAVRWEDALGLALEGWRSRRTAIFADLVSALGEKVPANALRAHTAEAFDALWLARMTTATPSDLGALLATLTSSLPVVEVALYATGGALRRQAAWSRRLEALARVPDDPRTAAALVDIVRKAPFSSGFQADVAGLYDPALALIARIADARVLESLRGLVDRPVAPRQITRLYLVEALPRVIAEIERVKECAAPVSADELARAERLLQALGKSETRSSIGEDDEPALFELVVANPEDDAAREVLADLWLERGDPRGEFATLQLKSARRRGSEDEAEQRAIRQLLREHDKTWMGELALVTKQRVYRRGFLDELELQQNSAADAKVWESAALDPRLGTVRKIHKGKANETRYKRFVFAPVMRSLRELTVVSKSMLKEVCERPLAGAIEHLRLDFMPDAKTFAALRAASVLPRLMELTVGVAQGNVDKVLPLVAAFAKERSLEYVAAGPLRWGPVPREPPAGRRRTRRGMDGGARPPTGLTKRALARRFR